MAGPLERRAVDPRGLEAERVELGPEHVADLPHAGEIQVPLLMSTTRCSSASAASLLRSTSAMMRLSASARA